MPAFELSFGSAEARDWYKAQPLFTQGYVEALLFVEEDALSSAASVHYLSEEARAQIVADCAAFNAKAYDLLETAYTESNGDYEPEQAGRDFWYTRNGHGTGFWDRDHEGVSDIVQGMLSDVAKAFAQCDVYLGDDNKIYLA